MSHKYKQLLTKSPQRLVGFTAVFAAIGILTLIITRAVNSATVSIEPENGTKNNATTCDDALASNGHCVKFASGNGISVVAVGDIVWPGKPVQTQTAALVKNIRPSAVMLLGDLAYTYNQDFQYNPSISPPSGDPNSTCNGFHYAASYFDTWGVFQGYDIRAISYPAVGNHEYIYEPNSTDGGAHDGLNNRTGLPDPSEPNFFCNRTHGKTYNDPAKPFFEYFRHRGAGDAGMPTAAADSREGYYSYDLGSWHIIVLNSECTNPNPNGMVPGGCGVNSPQWTWLKNDLETKSKPCTMAYFHRPPWYAANDGGGGGAVASLGYANPTSSLQKLENADIKEDLGNYTYNTKEGLYIDTPTAGPSGSAPPGAKMAQLLLLLNQHNADVLLTGHAHFYEHIKPKSINPTTLQPQRDPNGLTEFVVGTGGSSMQDISNISSSELIARSGGYHHNPDYSDHGVLRMSLKNGSMDYQYVGINAAVTAEVNDQGTLTCH